jgi:hypothetical protein
MKEIGKFYGDLVYFTAILYILWPFGMFCGHFGVFFSFGMLCQEKSGNPGFRLRHFKEGNMKNMFLRAEEMCCTRKTKNKSPVSTSFEGFEPTTFRRQIGIRRRTNEH